MTAPTPSIFRREALEYRTRQQARRLQAVVVFPRLMATRAWIALWALLVVLTVGAGLACLPAVPVRATGLAFAPAGERHVAVLVPGGVDGIHPGASATISLGGREVTGTVTDVDPAPRSPADIARRLGLPESVMAMVAGPVRLAWVEPTDPIPPGAAGHAEIRAGSRHAGSYLPLVGRFLRSDA